MLTLILEKPSLKKHVIGLVGVHIMKRCTEFDYWSDAFEVLAEMLNKKIYFYMDSSPELSPADIVKTAVCVRYFWLCMLITSSSSLTCVFCLGFCL